MNAQHEGGRAQRAGSEAGNAAGAVVVVVMAEKEKTGLRQRPFVVGSRQLLQVYLYTFHHKTRSATYNLTILTVFKMR